MAKEEKGTKIFCLPNGFRTTHIYTSCSNGNVVFAPPRGTLYLGHATYLKEKAKVNTNRAGIDSFLLAEGIDRFDPGYSPILKNIQENPYEGEIGIERRHAINYYPNPDMMNFLDVFIRSVNFDVWTFHLNKQPPAISGEPLVRDFNDLIFARPKPAGYAKIDGKYGKQAFHPECLADLNLDFSNWCVTSLTPDFRVSPELKCLICYSGFKQSGYPIYYKVEKERLKKQIEFLKAERKAKGLETRYLRIAKSTECGAPIFKQNLEETFKACIETGIKAFMPSKFLTPELAYLFRESDSTALVSLGDDFIEEGACRLRRTNEVRLRDALKMQDLGARVIPYVNVDALEELGGPYYREVLLDALLNDFEGMLILPIRIRKKKHAFLTREWDSSGPRTIDLDGNECGGCDITKDHQRLANYIHPSLASLIGDNTGRVRMCHHCKTKEWCGKCFMPGEKGIIEEATPPIINFQSKRPKREKYPHNQPLLFNIK